MVPVFQQRVVRVLEWALAERGHHVEWSTGLTAIEMDHGVTAHLDRGGNRAAIRAGWIVGCDGSHSIVRKTVSPDFPGQSVSGVQGLFCECDLDWKRSRDIWWTWQNKRGLVGAIYNDFTEKWHVLAVDFEQDDSAAGSEFARIGELLRLMSGDDVHPSNPAWVHSGGSFSQRIAEPFIMGRAALAGDAAHVFSSLAGQGLHFAIEDALNLGWKLGLEISGAASPALLQSYDGERRHHANRSIGLARSIQRFLTLPPAIRNRLWRLMYVVGKRSRSLGTIAAKQSEKLVTDYGESPLSRGATAQMTPHTRPGLHVRDAACRAGGRPTRLLEIIRGPHAHLMLFAGLRANAEVADQMRAIERSVASLRTHLHVHYVFPSQAHAIDAGFSEDDPRLVVDGLEKLHALFGIAQPESVYIRPDGYIGLRMQSMRTEALLDYLRVIYAGELLNGKGPI
jgi:2-polyprenyl-6-methoxyphenol hydroxylase-like FAD-dependent oxidoreductase